MKKPGSVWQYLAFNLKDPILSKVEVRRAIAHAINRQRIVQDLMRGYGVPTDTMLAQGHWARAENLPTLTRDDPEQQARHSMELLRDAPMDMGLGIKREAPRHY